MMDGACSIQEMSEKLHDNAKDLDRLAEAGFELQETVGDDYAFVLPP